MSDYVFTLRNVRKAHGDKVVLDNVTLSFLHGAKIGVVGPNGTGKSSLLKIMAGLDHANNGDAMLDPGATVGMLQQEPPLTEGKTVLENVEEAVGPIKSKLDRFNQSSEELADPDADYDTLLTEMGDLQTDLDHANAWDLDSRLDQAMDALRCPPPEVLVDNLSGGERRRVALCKLLLQQPDLLLLDEPTNHLDAESVQWLEGHLAAYPGCVLAVTHDRYFLDNVAGWILELDRGHGIPWKGNYSEWLEQKQRRLAIEQRTEDRRQKAMARELEWIRSGAKARQAKGQARINAYEQMLKQDVAEQEKKFEIIIPPGPRLGNLVVEAQGVSKAYGDKLLFENLSFALPPGPRLGSLVVEATNLKKAYGDKLLYEGLSFNLPPGGIVGVIGPNGAGKSTLFRILVGQETQDAGELRIGETVKVAYVDQSRDALDPNKTVFEEITGGSDVIEVGSYQTPSRAYVGRFNFKGADQQKRVGDLSGGERNRLHLAKLLKAGGNLLLLDEPTNDLDVETLRALETALLDFPGCAVVISHDRWFLDRIATHILAFEGDSKVVWFEGNYADYLDDRRKRLGDDADQPHRLRFKPLSA